METLVLTIAGGEKGGFRDGNVKHAQFRQPAAICVSHDGKLYVTDIGSQSIRMIADYQVTTIAGTGKSGFKDGAGHIAQFYNPCGICMTDDSKIYVADTDNHRIRMIIDHHVITIAGDGTSDCRDGNALQAKFGYPRGICVSKEGVIYVVDDGNGRIRRIADNNVTSINDGRNRHFEDGNIMTASFYSPSGICMSQDGSLYITESNGHRIRRMRDDIVTTILGDGKPGFENGNLSVAKISHPHEICITDEDTLYMADAGNRRIRMITHNKVTTIAGNDRKGFRDGLSIHARFELPCGICISRDGKLYVTDESKHTISMIDMSSVSSRFGLYIFSQLVDPPYFPDVKVITINHVDYNVHTNFIDLRCCRLLDTTRLQTIEKANITNTAIAMFMNYVYTNRMDGIVDGRVNLQCMVELLFMFDVFDVFNARIARVMIETLKTQLENMLVADERVGVEKVMPLLACMYRLLMLINTKPTPFHPPSPSSLTASLSEVSRSNTTKYLACTYMGQVIGYFSDQMRQHSAIVKDYLYIFQTNLTIEAFVMAMQHLLSESKISSHYSHYKDRWFECGLLALTRLAFDHTSFGSLNPTPTFLSEHEKTWCKTDFVITIDGDTIQEYYVHQFILCGRWRYFANMLMSGMAEACHHRMTLPSDWTPNLLEKLMKYIYLAQIEFTTLEDVTWLINNGRMYILFEEVETIDDGGAFTFETVGCNGFEALYNHCMKIITDSHNP